MVDTPAAMAARESDLPQIQQISARNLVLSRTRLMTIAGIEVGRVVDLIFLFLMKRQAKSTAMR